jgi:hypothetical protein
LTGKFTIIVVRMVESKDKRIKQKFIYWELVAELALDIPEGIAVDAPLKPVLAEKDPSWNLFGL